MPSVRDALSFYFQDANEVLEKPNNKIIIADGRRFLQRTSQKFDVITIDPPPPVEASGSGLLYSEEFYRILKTRLQEGGILQQWLPSGDKVTKLGVAKAIYAVFPFVRVFRSLEGWGLHFLASNKPFDMPSVDKFVTRLPTEAEADFIEWNPDKSPGMLYQKMLKGK